VKIVDEFTGAPSTADAGRGLHQAVEAKERVSIKEENHTWATVTLQNYFRLYEKLGGMTGTAETRPASSPALRLSVVRSRPTSHSTDSTSRPHLQVRRGEVQRRRRRLEERREKGQPCSSAPPRSPSPSC